MTEIVLDASVVIKWLKATGERHVEEAVDLRARYLAGSVTVVTAPLLRLEVLNVFGRRWRWPAEHLREMAVRLELLGFQFVEPPLVLVAEWTAAGLSAYDASYVALAETRGVPLVTDDDLVVRVADGLARPLTAPRP
ncbi:MAG: type II toxin-antitoxin system VapC family toxin [Actinomycetota bacterium]|nr:type II toxin-antitoxin system VapC family toxin [Actinomycetota bacterium]